MNGPETGVGGGAPPAACDAIVGVFVWGVQRCMAEAVEWREDEFGMWWSVCAEHAKAAS